MSWSWFSRLSLRARTLTVGCVLSACLLTAGAVPAVPFVALGPGLTYNTIGQALGGEVITFTGAGVPESAGEPRTGNLNMTTIRIIDRIPMFGAVGMWASGRFELAPREEYFPSGKSVEQVNQENARMFTDSQSLAEIEALRYLGYPNIAYVGNIAEGSPSDGLLQPQDQITAVDGEPVTDYDSLKSIMARTHPEQVVTITVQRDGKPVDATVTLEANAAQGPQGFLGVGIAERPKAPFTVHISLSDIGGPSAGLMFTLGIIDRLGPVDLAAGRFIAGTGTIDLDGNVGPIGGIQFKEVTARSAGATAFLVPAANCAEAAARVPDGLTLVKVGTLDEAMAALATLRAGGTPPGC